MRSPRTTAVVAGVFYLITHVTSVIGALLYASVLSDPDYILGAGGEGGLLFAALLELLLALSVVGTAVTLSPSSADRTRASRSDTSPCAPSRPRPS